MNFGKYGVADVRLERLAGQDAEIWAGNAVDERHGGPVTIGFGRYGPGARLEETIAVHDVMIVLDGEVTVTGDGRPVTAGPGEIVYMPEGVAVVIEAGECGAMTAYVTYPHWREARG